MSWPRSRSARSPWTSGASLEHDIRYKADKSRLPEGINEEMLAVSGKIADIDRQMQDMYLRIRAAETEKDE